MALIIIALLWGVAEATLFFIVPDVLLTWIVLGRQRPVPQCYAAALAGALLGGTCMYLWGGSDAAAANAVLLHVPAIDGAMLAAATGSLHEHGLSAMLGGSFAGVPYKIYAVNAAGAGIPLWLFLLYSIPARLLRWLLAGGLAWLLRRSVLAHASRRLITTLFVAFWLLFYAVFFALH